MFLRIRNHLGLPPLLLAMLLVACGGGGGGGGDGNNGVEEQPPRSIGGNVSGLAGSGLVLQNNSGSDLAVPAAGTFVFSTAVAAGSAYSVSVKTQPSNPAQTCVVANASGTVAASNITNVAVTCSTNTYKLSGTIGGLTGTGFTIQNNGAEVLAGANGAFEFATRVASNGAYAVTVKTQPTSPWQTCTVVGGAGVVTNADVTGIAITCTVNRYELGGTVSGMSLRLSRFSTPLVLSNGNDEVAVTKDGSFRLPAGTSSGNAYAVTIKTPPDKPSLDCSLQNASGQTSNADVTGISVTCVRSLGKLALVASYVSKLTSYQLGANGALTQAQQVSINGGSRSVALDPSGQYAYVQSEFPASIQAFAVNSATGALAAIGTAVPNAADPVQVVVHPSSNYLFSANQHGGATSQGSVSAYRINPATGALTEINTYTINYNPKGLAVDPSGRFLYVATSTSTTAALSIDAASGELTPLAGSPYSNGAGSTVPWSIAADPLGRFIYAVNSSTNVGVSGFGIDPSLGTLQPLPGSPYNTYADNRITVDPRGEFLFLADYTYPVFDIAGFSINPATGTLAPTAAVPYLPNAGARDIAFEPSGKYFYASGAAGIQGFLLNRPSGTWTALPGSPYPVTGEGDSIALY